MEIKNRDLFIEFKLWKEQLTPRCLEVLERVRYLSLQ